MKTITDVVVSECMILNGNGITQLGRKVQIPRDKCIDWGYSGGTPREWEAKKPKEGYPKVPCKHYIESEGKCMLRHFFPTHYSVDHNPCVFAE